MKQTAKQSDTTSDPETPEEERKNDFGGKQIHIRLKCLIGTNFLHG